MKNRAGDVNLSGGFGGMNINGGNAGVVIKGGDANVDIQNVINFIYQQIQNNTNLTKEKKTSILNELLSAGADILKIVSILMSYMNYK